MYCRAQRATGWAWLAKIFRWLGWGWVLASLPLAWWDAQGRWLQPGHSAVAALQLWTYWASWAALPLLADALWRAWQGPRRVVLVLWAGLLALVAYSSLLEPRLLVVHAHRLALSHAGRAVPPLRVAVVGDIHVGLFVRRWQLQRLVDVLNAQEVDAVLVVGDWVYQPRRDLEQELAALQRLRHPVFGVLGNHDTEAPGPALVQPLRVALQHNGVQLLEGESVEFRGWQFAGLGDLWGLDPRKDIAKLLPSPAPQPRLVVAHQPDTAALMPAASAALIVSGHTHGGQIWLPWITRNLVLPLVSAHGWHEGRHLTRAGPLFVTAGAGQIGLPARLWLVPRVDVLELVAAR